jgi:hypothetical protein
MERVHARHQHLHVDAEPIQKLNPDLRLPVAGTLPVELKRIRQIVALMVGELGLTLGVSDTAAARGGEPDAGPSVLEPWIDVIEDILRHEVGITVDPQSHGCCSLSTLLPSPDFGRD